MVWVAMLGGGWWAEAAHTTILHPPTRNLADASGPLDGPRMMSRPAEPDELPMEVLVAFDEYRVKAGRGAGFEQTFATRKSSLGLTAGFRFFALLRRVSPPTLPDAEPFGPEDDVNYISVTMWDSLEAYEAWGGQTWYFANSNILGKATSFVAGKLNLKEETPDEVIWGGVLHHAPPWARSTSLAAPEGWRQVNPDGTNLIPPDIFVAINKYSLANGVANAFENKDASASQKFHIDKVSGTPACLRPLNPRLPHPPTPHLRPSTLSHCVLPLSPLAPSSVSF